MRENPETQTLRAEIDVDNQIRPGQNRAATIILADLRNRARPPLSALKLRYFRLESDQMLVAVRKVHAGAASRTLSEFPR